LTPVDAVAQEQRPNCANFLDEEDAQVVFNADPSDPFGLDASGEGNNQACDNFGGSFGSERPLVNCDDLRDDPGIAQTLYDHSLRKYNADQYDLAACVEQGPSGAGQSESDAGSRNTGGSNVVVIARTGFSGETLEARLDAHFLALENRFADFEAGAENGFGNFPDSGSATTGGRGSTVIVSTSRQSVDMTQEAADSTGDSQVALAQKARPGRNDGTRDSVREKARKDGKADRGNKRHGKRDHHRGKQRNRR
jgi:hypothetical protein